MNTHAVLLERQYKRHIMSSFHALFSLGVWRDQSRGDLWFLIESPPQSIFGGIVNSCILGAPISGTHG